MRLAAARCNLTTRTCFGALTFLPFARANLRDAIADLMHVLDIAQQLIGVPL